jgi:hypothetical protein
MGGIMSLGVGNIGRNNVVSSGGGGGGGGGTVNILIASPDAQTWTDDAKAAMVAVQSGYPTYTLNITAIGNLTTLPTVTVGQYDAILFWSDGNINWNSSFDTVNANGTGLVTAMFYGSVGITGITSTIMPTVSASGGQASGPLTWPAGQTHPIAIGNGTAGQTVSSLVTGSNAFNASAATTLNSGASTVVTAAGSVPWVVVKNNTAPTGRTVFLNFWPVTSRFYSTNWNATTYPDGGKLLINACLYAARKI